MLIDAPGIRSRLQGIVSRLAPSSLREDLIQEAMIHLWHMEEEEPGRNELWYLQGCRFHLQNVLRQGRSVDSLKRFGAQVLSSEQAADECTLGELAEPNESLWEEVSANDFLTELSYWLTAEEKETLVCLMEGLTARETAKRLNVSHTMVNRYQSALLRTGPATGPAWRKKRESCPSRNSSHRCL